MVHLIPLWLLVVNMAFKPFIQYRTADQLKVTGTVGQLFHARACSDWSVAHCDNLVNMTHPSDT